MNKMTINFFNISDFSKDKIISILDNDHDTKILQNKSIGLLFEKYSTRTRLSFTVGITSLGGSPINIRFDELNISGHESFEDTFRAMECYLDGLIYRTKDHENLTQASRFFRKPIINALSDISHPCQALSDLLTIKEHFSSLNIHILWMGDMNNVCYSLVETVNLIQGLKLTICTPKFISDKIEWNLGSNISVVSDLKYIDLQSVKCVMTDVFISMNDKKNDEKIKLLKPYAVDSKLMSKTNSNSIFMHCLPAQIGYEVSEDVIRSSKSIVWKQAYNRMIAQKKLLRYIYE